jgi:hypothetical protein
VQKIDKYDGDYEKTGNGTRSRCDNFTNQRGWLVADDWDSIQCSAGGNEGTDTYIRRCGGSAASASSTRELSQTVAAQVIAS